VVLEFREDAGTLVASKVSGEDAVASVYGILDVGPPVDELVDELRGVAEA
jgi:hypothetical protein